MFGIGKLLGSVAGGLLDKIGLGKLAPFVQMGLNAMTGNWLGVAKDVFSLVSNFKGNFLDNASNKPPLGGFEQARADQRNPLNSNRLTDLFSGLRDLLRGFRAMNNGNEMRGFSSILNAFRTLSDAFGNNQLYTNRASISQYTNIQV